MKFALCLEQTLGHRAHASNLAAALERSGLDGEVVSVEFHEGGRVPWAFRASWDVARRLLRRRHDVRFFHTQSASLFAPFVAFGRPYVVSVDATPGQIDAMGRWYGHDRSSGPMEAGKARWYRFVLRRASRVVAWSQWAADSLVNEYGVAPERIRVIHPGAPPEFFGIPRDAPPGRRPTVLFVGTDLERKGGDLLLGAHERMPSAFDLLMVTTADVDVHPGVQVIADATPGSGVLRSAYARADLFCLPTRGDCTPVVLGEAMAAGLPVITTRIGSNCETVADGVTGVLIDVDDEAGLDAALLKLVTDRELQARMARAAREEAVGRFDAERNAGQIFALLAEAAS